VHRFVVAAACLAVLANCAGSSVSTPLPIEGSRLGNRADINDEWRTIPYRFVLPNDLAVDVKRAPAYRLTGEITQADVARLASALGVPGSVERGEASWIGGVFDGSGLGFSVSDDRSFILATYLPPSKCEDTFFGGSAICVAPTTTTLVAPRVPSTGQAQFVAREALERAGIPVDGASVTTTKETEAVEVRFFRHVDGLRAAGFELLVDVDDDGVAGAYGLLGRPTFVGEYELTSLAHAVNRLNALAAGSSEQFEIELRSVEIGLMVADTEPVTWLVPAFLFTTEDGRTVAAPAAKDQDFAQSGN
jgi:hypothetical protein